jgi:LmbE family N-acetylglucosaminyl deacetylase
MSNSDRLGGVLFVGAHPDDETVMAGGTLALLHTQGVATHVLCATDGRGGESGGVPEATTPESRARVRESELRCAVETLGVVSLTLLGYIDPVIGPDEELFAFEADFETLVRQIADQIQRTGASVVVTHGSNGEYGHSAHVQVHRAVLHAVQEQAPGVLVYTVAARVPDIEDRLWNTDDPADLVLDITPWFEAKLAAMLCHRTQHELFKRRRKLETVREAVRTLESFHRCWPVLPGDTAPHDPFAALLLHAGAWQPQGHA